MKILTFGMLATAALLLASCANDEPLVNGGNGYQDGKVLFDVEMPGSFTRSGGDGLKAVDLTYVVFDESGNYCFQNTFNDVIAQDPNDGKLKAKVQVPLAKDMTYTVAFVAYNHEAPYTITEEGTLTIDDTTLEANNDKYDAFYEAKSITVSANMTPQTVTLTRPFAQVNFCATDWQDAKNVKCLVDKTAMSFTAETYTTLNLLNGEASGLKAMNFVMNDLLEPKTPFAPCDIDVQTKTYDHVAMAYVLAPKTGSETVATVTMTYNNASANKTGDLAINSVPVARNHRTNIVGRFFTEGVEYEIIVDQDFKGEENYDVETYNGQVFRVDRTPWDGVSIAAPYVDKNDENQWYVGSAAQLAGLAGLVNGTYTRSEPELIKNKNIVLLVDVDLNNELWTPIGNTSRSFLNLFNGNGKTIKNLYVNTDEIEGHNGKAVGLFGVMHGKIQNLVVDGATVKGHHWVGVIAGYSTANVGMMIDNCVVKNFTIENTTINNDDGDKTGGIIGYCVWGDTVKNCKVYNGRMSGYRDLGGVIGYAYEGTIIENLYAEKVEIVRDLSCDYDPSKAVNMSPLIGNAASIGFTSTNYKDVKVTSPIPEKNSDGAYVLNSGAQLKYVLDNVIRQEGGTFILEADLDMKGIEIPDLGKYSKNITIVGNSHTISNVTMSGYSGTALFGKNNSNTTITDLTLKDCSFVGNTGNVDNAEDGESTAGAFLGFTDFSANINFTDCTLDNVTVGSAKYVGGFIGYSSGTCSYTRCTIKNSHINSDYYDLEDQVYKGHAGAIAGRGGSTTTITNCKVLDNVFSVQGPRGGILVGTTAGTVNAYGCTISGNTGLEEGRYIAPGFGTLNFN